MACFHVLNNPTISVQQNPTPAYRLLFHGGLEITSKQGEYGAPATITETLVHVLFTAGS